MRGFPALLALGVGLTLAAPAVQAEIDGHGPDAWRVTGVAGDDVLNMRMGPGTEYLVIDSLPPDARGLEQITCVPLLIPSIYHRLSEAERADLPPRWCLMRSRDFAKAGWVAQRFLMEDGLEEVSAPRPGGGGDVVKPIGDPQIDGAAYLVGDLYAGFEAAMSSGRDAENPFAPENADGYFFADLVPILSGHGADLLYGGQDFQGAVTRIAPDALQPMFRGTIQINVAFTNFGRDQSIAFYLRPDTGQPDAPYRIHYIEHDDWSFPE
ncbi:SH3 domain-containing protein [Oceaniglobus trochenteri]|uniref:SH3 domain-containing protein n=1 Tax=Oceaniglobus trochenteri TaxID=2763260 RepID=UPI001CFFF178|nr:hypothetical protein [Oceaniglobus trochenteri]